MSIFPSIFFVFFVFFSSSLYAEEIAPTAESQPETRAQTQKSSSVAQVYFQFNRSKPNFE